MAGDGAAAGGRGWLRRAAQRARRGHLASWAHRIGALLVFAWIAERAVELLSLSWDFDTDDAFITLRYARNLVQGHGVVWNVGEPPVEGYSNFTTLLIAAASMALGYDALHTVKVVNSVGLALSCVFMYVLARGYVGPLAACAPAALLTAYIGTVMWTPSGLETAMYQCLLVVTTCAVTRGLGYRATGWHGGPPQVRAHDDRWIVAGAVLAALAGMTRPEGPLMAVVAGAALAARLLARWLGASDQASVREALRSLLWFCAVFGGLYGAYFGWRLWYFGRLLPNTVYCKASWRGDPWELIHDFWTFSQPVWIAAVMYPVRRLDVRHVMLLGLPALYLFALYGVDPIVAYHNRHFLPSYALLLVAAAAGLGSVLRAVLGGHGWHREVLLIGLVLLSSVPQMADTEQQIISWSGRYARRMHARRALGEYLRRHVPQGGTYVLGDCGLAAFTAPQRAIDAFCLNSRQMTSAPINLSAVEYAKWVLAQRPDVIVVHSRHRVRLRPRKEYGFYRALVERPEFIQHYRRVHTSGAVADRFYYFVYKRIEPGAATTATGTTELQPGEVRVSTPSDRDASGAAVEKERE